MAFNRARAFTVLLLFSLFLAGCFPPNTNTPPTASFVANPSRGPAPLTVAFDASGSFDPDGQIVSYSWNFGDGATGSGITATHAYTNPGTYTVRLTVRDNQGATDNTTRSITVTEHPSVSYRVTVGEIIAEFQENEYAATNKYSDKVIAVSGYVEDIGVNDFTDEPFVVLAEHPNATAFDPSVICYFTKTGPHPGLADLRKGDYATIVGEFWMYSDLFEAVYLKRSYVEL